MRKIKLCSAFLFCIFFLLTVNLHAGDTVGVVKTRDYIVEIVSSSTGRTFTVKTVDGQVLATQLTESEFSSKYPDLVRYVEHSKPKADDGQ